MKDFRIISIVFFAASAASTLLYFYTFYNGKLLSGLQSALFLASVFLHHKSGRKFPERTSNILLMTGAALIIICWLLFGL